MDIELINHLERLSLVEFGNKQGIERLETAVRFAYTLLHIDTSDVEPMISVLEDRSANCNTLKAMSLSQSHFLNCYSMLILIFVFLQFY